MNAGGDNQVKELIKLSVYMNRSRGIRGSKYRNLNLEFEIEVTKPLSLLATTECFCCT